MSDRIFRASGPLPSGRHFRMWVMPTAVVLLVSEADPVVHAQRHIDVAGLRDLSTALSEASA
ncbi:MAG: hypothetical protein K0Q93_3313 [Nocardioidaceae bacterium]|nr:hypothetical protein [Nocardioidaceae bacterium]